MKILNLKQYELVFTTSFYTKHGVSGHMYELIDYYYVCKKAGINCAILLADGVDKEAFLNAVQYKYNLDIDILADTHQCHNPRIIMTNNICLVDGSWRVNDCTIYADNAFLLRCSEDDFTFFDKNKSIKKSHIMQDFKLYSERFEDLNVEVVDYIKKIMWSKYVQPTPTNANIGLLYLTTNCRAIPVEEVQSIMNKGICDKYLIVTDKPKIYGPLASDTVEVVQAPVQNIFEHFDTYIYTTTELRSDCSPRFVVECAVFGKQVVYEIDYVCAGLERRKQDIEQDLSALELTVDDQFVTYVKQFIYDTN